MPTEIVPEQAKGIIEQILVLGQIIEKALEFNLPHYVLSVNFHKAFDKVQWCKLR